MRLKSLIKKVIYRTPYLGDYFHRKKRNQYESQFTHLIPDFFKTILPQKQCLAFDIGANTGYISEALLSLKHKVVAVEPVEACCKQLEKRFLNNPLFTLEKIAVSNKVGESVLYINQANSLSTLSTECKAQHESFVGTPYVKQVAIQTTTLAELIKKHGLPYFCKVDVEGFEKRVFETLETPIPLISFEYHVGKQYQGYFEEAIEIMEQLSSLGNYEFNLCHGASYKLYLPTWQKLPTFKTQFTEYSQKVRVAFGDIYAQLQSSVAMVSIKN